MTALLNWRLWAAVILAVGLAASHWKAYTSGGKSVRVEWDKERAELTAAALAASEAARIKEKALNLSLDKVRNDYAKEKSRRAADAVATAGRLSELQAALDSASSADPTGSRGADDPRNAIIHQCTGALVGMDEYAKGVADKASALQRFAATVCVAP